MGKAKLAGDTWSEHARHISRADDLWEQVGRYLKRREYLVGPAMSSHVEEQRTRRVRRLGGELAGEPIPDVVLGEKKRAEPVVAGRLVLTEPEQLGGGKPLQGEVADGATQSVQAESGGHLATLLSGTDVVPQKRGPDYRTRAVEKDRAVHLTGQANGSDLHSVRKPADSVHDGRYGALCGAPPHLRALLRPSWARDGGRLLNVGFGYDTSQLIDRDGLHRRGAYVYADEG